MDSQDQRDDYNHPRHNGRIFAGLFLLLVGAAFFMRELSFPFFPDWLFTWPMILIAVGIYTGIKHEFRNPGWLILVVIGGIFLADQTDIGFNFHRFLVPILIITVGFVMIMRPRRHGNWRWRDWDDWKQKSASSYGQDYARKQEYATSFSSEDFFDSTSIFGAAKKNILSKNFQGGDITCFFGGCEIDLSKADIQKTAVLDLTFVFGGGKIIVPSNWQISFHMTPVFGGIEDKRQQPLSDNPDKILIIKGTCVFGGLEIKNY